MTAVLLGLLSGWLPLELPACHAPSRLERWPRVERLVPYPPVCREVDAHAVNPHRRLTP